MNTEGDPSVVDCRIVAFPAVGSWTESGGWKVELEGFVYERRELSLRKRMLLRLLRRYMKVEAEDFGTPLFQDRIDPFVAATEKGFRPEVRLHRRPFEAVRPTPRNGRFQGVVHLEAGELDEPADLAGGPGRTIGMSVRHPGGTDVAPGAFLVPPRGVSVVSDIDDTIKHTIVRDRREMLMNTFLRPFVPIEGMAAAYRTLADRGAVFHYVSSSPWQLFAPLSELIATERFPAGSMHLRDFRLRDHMLRRMFLLHRRGKGGAIRHLMERFPGRRFLLVGDSGERDAQIYAKLARRFPGQVLGILIRLLEDRHEAELREKLRDRPGDLRHLKFYRTSDELLEIVEGLWVDEGVAPSALG